MFFRKPPKRPPEPPKPQWFRWGFIIFILIVLMLATKPDEQTGVSSWERTTSNIAQTMPDFGSYRNYIPGQSSNKVQVLKAGEGRSPICGQTVTVTLSGYVRDEKVSRDREETFSLGAKEISPQLRNAVMQVQPGGEYRIALEKAITIPELLGKDPQGEEKITNIEATLLSASPDVSALFAENQLGLRSMDIVRGNGVGATCGETIEVSIITYDATGTAAEPVSTTLTPGSNTQMLGLEYGVIGLAPNASRMLIIPPAWQRPLEESTENPVIQLTETVLILDVTRTK